MARELNARDWQFIAEWIVQEKDRRAQDRGRKDKERLWNEVDRQIAMQPRRQVPRSGDKSRDWMPDMELPLQADAFEILIADARRLLFPPGADWYVPHALRTDEYLERTKDETLPVIGQSLSFADRTAFTQEVADLIVKAVIDHFHNLMEFRSNWERAIAEAIRYGTLAGRAVLARPQIVSREFRGVVGRERRIPMFVPVPIRNFFPDDAPQYALFDGESLEPGHIRVFWQRAHDLANAAQAGDGWRKFSVDDLVTSKSEDARKKDVEVIEFEGDLIVPRSRGDDIDLRGVLVKVARARKPLVVRFKERDLPFGSYIHEPYIHEDAMSPYGTSPLMKGAIIQDAATEAWSRTMQAAALNAEPAVEWDQNDGRLAAMGGPVIAPGEKIGVDTPGSTRTLEIGDPAALAGVAQALDMKFEDITKVKDPRRGEGPKSHTTATGNQIAESRGVLPTETFVERIAQGPMKTWLYMHWEMAKKAIASETVVFMQGRGLDGFVQLERVHLPDRAEFEVMGARGEFDKNEKRRNWVTTIGLIAQTEPIAVQMGAPPSNWNEIRKETYAQFGIVDSDRYLPGPGGQGGSAEPAGGPAVPADIASSLARLAQG